jgi:hypothetical protein
VCYRLDVVYTYEYTAERLKLLWFFCRTDMKTEVFLENGSLSFDSCFHATDYFPLFTELSISVMFLVFGYKVPLESHNLKKKLPSRISPPLYTGGVDDWGAVLSILCL